MMRRLDDLVLSMSLPDGVDVAENPQLKALVFERQVLLAQVQKLTSDTRALDSESRECERRIDGMELRDPSNGMSLADYAARCEQQQRSIDALIESNRHAVGLVRATKKQLKQELVSAKQSVEQLRKVRLAGQAKWGRRPGLTIGTRRSALSK